MTDVTFPEGDESIIRKYKDNGDGSYTEYVEAELNVGDINIGNVDISSIATGDNNIGNVDIVTMPATKGNGFSIPITLTVTNGAYTIGDAVGGLITIPNAVSANGKHGVIYNFILSGVVANPYNLFFFASDIATPADDNAVGTMVAADIAMCKGVIPIVATDYIAPVSAFNVATIQKVLAYSCTATTLYAYLIAVAVTSPGTTTLTLTLKGEWID